MKNYFNKTMLLASALFVGNHLMAQTDSTSRTDYVQPFSGKGSFRTWSIGVNGGLLTPYTIFRGHDDYDTPNSNVGYGGYIRDQFAHSFAGQLSFFRGNVEGTGPVPGGVTSIRDSYKTNIDYAVDIQGQFTLANISWRNQKNGIQPYFGAGFGLMQFSPRIRAANNGPEVYWKPNGNVKAAYIPVGLGLKFNVSNAINLNLAYQVNFVDGDNFDGYNIGSTNDKFSYASVGLEFALGKKSKPQLVSHNPVNSMRHEYMWKEQQLQSQLDAERAANQQLRSDLANTNNNLNTLSATVAGLTKDSDGDGVLDINDKCPNTPAGTKVDGSGCPLPKSENVKVYVTQQDREVVARAVKNLEFDFNKSTIKEHSLPALDRLADLLNNKPLHLKLAGYTDNVGSQAFNLKLSKERAAAVRDYLLSKGVNESMIQSEGYGKLHPIASNKTAAGRARNRRVEFTLY